MKADLARCFALLAALLASVGFARAQDVQFSHHAAGPDSASEVQLASATAGLGDYSTPCGSCAPACDECCGGRWFADFEATFMRYHRNDNLQQDNLFDFDLAPRLTIGYISDDGFGARARWWDYDQTAQGAVAGAVDNIIRVDTYNIDFELFQNLELTECVSVEFCGGIRYNDFRETIADSGDDVIQEDIFSGVGAIFGIKARRLMLGGNVYARWNTAIIASNHNAVGGHGLEFDQTLTQTEIGFGFERSTMLANGSVAWWRIGLETSNWSDYVHDSDDDDDNTAIGFTGLVLGVGFIR